MVIKICIDSPQHKPKDIVDVVITGVLRLVLGIVLNLLLPVNENVTSGQPELICTVLLSHSDDLVVFYWRERCEVLHLFSNTFPGIWFWKKIIFKCMFYLKLLGLFIILRFIHLYKYWFISLLFIYNIIILHNSEHHVMLIKYHK